jgi:hypothetical protein
VAVPNTGGWQNWATAQIPVTLAAGQQSLRVVVDTGGFNIGTIDVAAYVPPVVNPTPTPTTTDPAPTTTDPAPTPTDPTPTSPSSTDTGSTTSGNVINVPAGGDLQAAINKAVGGDTILLAAGATYTGNFRLPAKGNAMDITIATAGTLPLIGTRVTPAMAPQMAKIASGNTSTALATDPYAQHYVLRFIEFLPNVNGYGDVITLGDGSLAQNSSAMVPHDLKLIQLYIHGSDATGQKRGVGLNSASTKILDCRIENIWASGQDSQAIGGWNGPGPYEIDNNYLEAASENVLFGGADVGVPGSVPSDITFTHNYLTKRLAWRSLSDRNVKNIFELKSAQRVHVEGNVFENNWLQAQAGYAIVLTVRAESGNVPQATVQDVLFVNNVVRHVSSAINFLGQDNYWPSIVEHNIEFRNNLFHDVNTSFGGDGRWVLTTYGYDFRFNHNTIISNGSSAIYAYGAPTPTQQFVLTNNIMYGGQYGVMGEGTGPGNSTINTFYPNATILRNVITNQAAYMFPTGNFYPASLNDVGFVDLTNGNYRLSSTSIYKAAGTDGKDLGADLDAINAAAGTTY